MTNNVAIGYKQSMQLHEKIALMVGDDRGAQAAIAKAAGIDKSQFSKILKGGAGLTLNRLKKLEEVFGVKFLVDDLPRQKIPRDIEREIWDELYFIYKSTDADPLKQILRDRIADVLDLAKRLTGAFNESNLRGKDGEIKIAVSRTG